MENKEIIKLLKNTSKLMELFGENEFKIRGYNNAVFALEKTDTQLQKLSAAELEKLDGIGKSIAASIAEINETGTFSYLEELLSKTPEGVLDMLNISGLGPKKIKVIWQEKGITTLDELKQACEKGEIASIKGFGEKTQQNILEALDYLMANIGKLHYSAAEKIAEKIMGNYSAVIDAPISSSAELRRKMEIIEQLSFVCAAPSAALIDFIQQDAELDYLEKKSGPFNIRCIHTPSKVECEFRICKPALFPNTLFLKTAHPRHLHHVYEGTKTLAGLLSEKEFSSEEEIYQAAGLPFMAPELREGLFEWELINDNSLPPLVSMEDLKGILHNHSTYSDGAHSLREMAVYCKELGYEYLGISDHSKTAQYAQGLYENKVQQQHEEIDLLNKELAPFRIFKGIESDILPDGSLDYADEVLASFDFIVASIHSGLSMDIEKATQRLIKAIENPYTTMLGHPTGRLLLKREGYPIDHKAVIDACAKHGVMIEINANPWRLDLDWRWVRYATSQGVMISINPDAHSTEGYHDMYYGVCVGRKAGLTPDMTFNALPLNKVDEHFIERRKRIAKP